MPFKVKGDKTIEKLLVFGLTECMDMKKLGKLPAYGLIECIDMKNILSYMI